nr:cobalt ECF transporter T component CbiQ [uncultured Cohaesibacter sp.]
MSASLLPTDLRIRLVVTLLIVCIFSQLQNLAVALAACIGCLLLALLEHVERDLWRRLLHMEAFVLLIFCTMPFVMPGTGLFSIGPLQASLEGVIRAALIGCKISASVLLLMIFLGSVEPIRLGAALHALHIPETLVRLFVMTVRYVSVIRMEAARLRKAMQARAFRPTTNRHTWTSYSYLIGMLLVRSLDRAHRVENAMLCRGYCGRYPYAELSPPRALDWLSCFALLVIACGLLLFDRFPIWG